MVMKTSRRGAFLAHCLLALLLLADVPAEAVESGGRMPPFALKTFDDVRITEATFDGKPLVLVFWNTWCTDCRRELPVIERLASGYGPLGLDFLAVNTAINDSEAKARAYWSKHGFSIPAAYDQTFEAGDAFSVRGVPTIFVFDAQGKAVFKGAIPPDNIEELLGLKK
jgi:thiol-disulfide isomerase/thioredoxin